MSRKWHSHNFQKTYCSAYILTEFSRSTLFAKKCIFHLNLTRTQHIQKTRTSAENCSPFFFQNNGRSSSLNNILTIKFIRNKSFHSNLAKKTKYTNTQTSIENCIPSFFANKCRSFNICKINFTHIKLHVPFKRLQKTQETKTLLPQLKIAFLHFFKT